MPTVGEMLARMQAENTAITDMAAECGVELDQLLPCGLCYRENGQEIHPHPECALPTPTED